MKPSPEVQSDPTADSTTTKPAEPEPQVLPRLLARIGSEPDRVPPDRGIFREYLDLKIGTGLVFAVPHRGEGTRRQQRGDPRRIRASTVHHVCWILYGRANAAGIIQDFTEQGIAADSHGLALRTVADALAVIEEELHIVGRTRRGRRSRAVYALALGTLTWPEVVRRARRERRQAGAPTALDFEGGLRQPLLPEPPSDDEPSSLSDDGSSSPTGLRTEGGVRTAVAAGYPGVEDRADGAGRGPQQQQEEPTTPPADGRPDAGDEESRGAIQATDDGTHRRLEGLIGAIAARSRELREPFDEEHTRVAFGAGELTLGCLQARADELQSALEAGPPPRSRSRRTERPDLTDEEHHAWLAAGRDPAAVRRLREAREPQ